MSTGVTSTSPRSPCSRAITRQRSRTLRGQCKLLDDRGLRSLLSSSATPSWVVRSAPWGVTTRPNLLPGSAANCGDEQDVATQMIWRQRTSARSRFAWRVTPRCRATRPRGRRAQRSGGRTRRIGREMRSATSPKSSPRRAARTRPRPRAGARALRAQEEPSHGRAGASEAGGAAPEDLDLAPEGAPDEQAHSFRARLLDLWSSPAVEAGGVHRRR